MRWIIFTLVFLVTFARKGHAEPDNELLVELIRSGIKQARESIITFDITYKSEPNVNRPKKPAGQAEKESAGSRTVRWVQASLTVARWRDSRDDFDMHSEYLWKGGVLKSVSHQAGPSKQNPTESGNLTPLTKQEYERRLDHPWAGTLNHSPVYPHPSIDELLGDPDYGAKVTTVVRDQHKLYRITSGREKQPQEIWIDAGRNFLIVKQVSSAGSKNPILVEVEVISAREVKPGIFFPEVVEGRHQRNGKVFKVNRWTFTNVRINDPVDPAMLELKFPENLRIIDEVGGTFYKTGPNEQPTGQRPLKVREDGPASPPRQSGRWYWWLLGLLALAAGTWLVRRQSRPATT